MKYENQFENLTDLGQSTADQYDSFNNYQDLYIYAAINYKTVPLLLPKYMLSYFRPF